MVVKPANALINRSVVEEKIHLVPESEFTRPAVQGKFLNSGGRKLWIKGVSYGTFEPNESGNEFHDRKKVETDLKLIASYGFNAVRTYTVPPRWLLDSAYKNRLRVMVGLPWEQHITFLDERRRSREIRDRIAIGVSNCAGHPAVLCYAIGNEIPAPIARWHGPRRIEHYLRSLWEAGKAEDPEALFTYVNFPSTEYLELDFADLVCFNVYLETPQSLTAYIARLQNLAGNRPLLLAELGLDSIRNGEDTQAEILDWQVRTAFAEGCVGTFVFSWTDEWYRGGHHITDWAFGLTDRDRREKPVLKRVVGAFSEAPFRVDKEWPRISVVVCSHNGQRTIRDCLDGLMKLDYPNYEVVVVDDGSTDATADIAAKYRVRVISTENRGLSSARNTGLEAATGEIVAYIDDDAYPDPDWLKYLARTFMTTEYVGVGGPNIPPAGSGLIADSVAAAPGGPIHVLLSDREAEHIPGCNMAFRKSALDAVGGFDTRFRAAGDDVDICWRLQKSGGTLGFNPAAVVWHYRRNSVRAFWKQQRGYGKAEALLEMKWPEKYNAAGHLNWAGRIYSPMPTGLRTRFGRVFHGVWGGALFQSVYEPAAGLLSSLPSMPEWYLIIAALSVISVMGALWRPALAALPLLLGATGWTVGRAVVNALRASFPTKHGSGPTRFILRATTAFLFLMQPLARLIGRLRHGLSPWRRHSIGGPIFTKPKTFRIWSEHWRGQEEWLGALETVLRKTGARVTRGGDFDRWDFDVSVGTFGSIRLLSVIEEHGGGRQLVRFRLRRWYSRWTFIAAGILATLAAFAAADHALSVSIFFAVGVLLVVLRTLSDVGAAVAAVRSSVQSFRKEIEASVEEEEPSFAGLITEEAE